MKADLHLHSTASDGILAPDELIALAAELSFTHLALTDHDSVEGIGAAYDAAQDCGVELIAGVELSCGAQKEIHILGYGFDPAHFHRTGSASYGSGCCGCGIPRAAW